MAVVIAQLSIDQGATFRIALPCTIPSSVVAPSGATLEDIATKVDFVLYWYEDAVRPRQHVAYAAFDGNDAILTVTKEGTDALAKRGGTYAVHATIGADRWLMIHGGWKLHRTSSDPESLQTAYENFDGLDNDCAAQSDATVDPEDKRMWVAHGRLRSAVRLSDGLRMNREDAVFALTNAAAFERVLALELDEANGLLYTLTSEGGLYCDSIAVPSAPVRVREVSIASALASGETLVDLKLWTAVGEEVIVVLTARRLLTIRTIAGVLTLVGSTASVTVATPLTDANPVPADSINLLLVIDHSRLRIGKDSDGLLTAYVQCSSRAYELTPITRPFAQILVLCNLDLAGGFVAPSFTTPGAPYCVFYNPFPVAPSGWAALVAAAPIDPEEGPTVVKKHYNVTHYQAVDLGASQLLYVAHGRRNQVIHFDVSHALTAGWPAGTQVVCHPNFGVDPYTAKDLTHIDLDPTDDQHFLVQEESSDGARVVDIGAGTFNLLAGHRFDKGGTRDNCAVALAGRHFTVWSVDTGSTDYLLRAIDASTNVPESLVNQPWFWNTDGMVALPPSHIYQLTFMGVLPYVRSGLNGEWYPEPAGYQPAQVPDPDNPGSVLESNTETIDIALDVASVGDHRLFTCSAKIGIMEYKLDATTKLPGPARLLRFPYQFPDPLFPDWSDLGSGTFYSNDVVPAVIDGEQFVFADITNRPLGQWALAAFRLDRSSDTWSLVSSAIVQSSYAPYAIPFTQSVTITRDLDNHYALVQSGTSFFMVDISNLASRGRMRVTSFHYLTGISTANDQPGSATSGNRIFIVVWKPIANPTGAAVYVLNFDVRTGVVDFDNPVQILQSSSLTLPAGHSFDKGFKTRFLALDTTGRGALYVCGAFGTLMEFSYDPSDRTPLKFKSSWKADYANALTDAHPADFGDGVQILLPKNVEGFALVVPSVR